MAFAFEKLIVYQKAVDFADKICATTSNFPKGYYFLRAAELKTAQAENDRVKINNCISSLTDAKIRISFFGGPEIISKLASFYRAGGVIDKAETGGLFLEFCKAAFSQLLLNRGSAVTTAGNCRRVGYHTWIRPCTKPATIASITIIKASFRSRKSLSRTLQT